MRSQRAASTSSASTSTSAELEQVRGLAAGRGAGVEHARVRAAGRARAAARPAARRRPAPRQRRRRSREWPAPGAAGPGSARARPTGSRADVGGGQQVAQVARARCACAFTRSVIGAGVLLAARIASQSRGQSCCSARRSTSAGGSTAPPARCRSRPRAASRSRRKRRRQALMKACWARVCGERLAASTAWSTSVNGGIRRVLVAPGAAPARCTAARRPRAAGRAWRARRRSASARPSWRSTWNDERLRGGPQVRADGRDRGRGRLSPAHGRQHGCGGLELAPEGRRRRMTFAWLQVTNDLLPHFVIRRAPVSRASRPRCSAPSSRRTPLRSGSAPR